MNNELVDMVEKINKESNKHFPQTKEDEKRRKQLISVVGPQMIPHKIEGVDEKEPKPIKISNRKEPRL